MLTTSPSLIAVDWDAVDSLSLEMQTVANAP